MRRARPADRPCQTLKLALLVATPCFVVTLILPVRAPRGTLATISVGVTTVKVAPVPPNRTAFAPRRFLPVIATDEPGLPAFGVNPRMTGFDVAAATSVDSTSPQTSTSVATA